MDTLVGLFFIFLSFAESSALSGALGCMLQIRRIGNSLLRGATEAGGLELVAMTFGELFAGFLALLCVGGDVELVEMSSELSLEVGGKTCFGVC